jgi:hypothetical protein
MKNVAKLSIEIVFLFLMVACSSEPKKSASENKPAESKPAFQPTYYTGREALHKMYIAARLWSADAKPYNLQSQATKDANGQNGKSGIWQAGFASPGRNSVRVFTWSGIVAEGAPEPGISARPEDTYNPANTSTQVFDIAFLRIDSDQAVGEADKHGGDKLIKQDTNTLVFYTLDWSGRENKLIWHVLYGPGRDEPKLRVAVDASTGLFIRVEK